jgi:fatty acid desaturase
MSGDAVAARAMPGRLNLGYACLLAGLALAAFLGVPMALAAGHASAAWLLVPFVLATVPHWALIHECVHGHCHPRRGVNEAAGRVLAILFLAPFDGLRFGHLSHHALNARPSERPEFYDPAERSGWRAAAAFYARLLCGVYLLEVASGPLALLPRRVLRPVVRWVFYDGTPDAAHMADRAERVLLAPDVLGRMRRDALLILVLLGTAFWLYGPHWPLLLLALLGRAFLVSFLDNAPHYDGALAEPDQGYDLRLPRPLARLVLNTNLHGTHHRHPNLPWTALPGAFARDGVDFAGSYLLTPWRQLRGPMPLSRGFPMTSEDRP